MRYRVSIDPGTTATGVCVWDSAGKAVDLFTLRPDKGCGSSLLKSIALGGQLRCKLSSLVGAHTIAAIALEAWEFHSDHDEDPAKRRPKKAMIACGSTLGALAMVARGFTSDVRHVTKGRISKEQSKLLAKSRGVIDVDAKGTATRGGKLVSKDAIDAYQIGVCAGFDKRLPDVQRS